MTAIDDIPISQGQAGEGDTLNPVTGAEKSWGWFAIFNIWANDIQSLFGYSLVASLFISYGVSGWTAFAALIVAGLMVMFLVNISGAAGERYGIPYPVLARASMGTAGAKLPAILRATVAVFWYGVQVYFASTALALLIRSVTGATGGETLLGLTGIDWFSFVLVWAFHILIFWRGMGWVETFLNIAGPFVYVVMIGLVIVLWQRSDGQLLQAAQTIFANPDATWGSEISGFIAIVGTMVAYFAAVMINFSDFSRYAKDRKAMLLGNLAGLPFNMILFSALALLTTLKRRRGLWRRDHQPDRDRGENRQRAAGDHRRHHLLCGDRGHQSGGEFHSRSERDRQSGAIEDQFPHGGACYIGVCAGDRRAVDQLHQPVRHRRFRQYAGGNAGAALWYHGGGLLSDP